MVFGLPVRSVGPLTSLHDIQKSMVIVPAPAEASPLAEKLKAAAWKASGGGLAGAGGTQRCKL